MNKISFTQLITYARCPEHFLFRYVLGVKRPPTKFKKQGFAFHETLAFYFEQKKEYKEILDIKDLKDFYAQSLGFALADYETELESSKNLLTKEYLKKEKEIKAEDLLDCGVKGLESYYKDIRNLKPDLIEADFSFQVSRFNFNNNERFKSSFDKKSERDFGKYKNNKFNKENLEIIGRIDLSDTSNVLYDIKTTRKTPRSQEVQYDPQLTIYQLGYRSLKSIFPRALAKDYIVFAKKEPKIIRFKVKNPYFKENSLLQNVRQILSGIENRVFYCLHPSESWVCSKEWCGYYKLHEEIRKFGLEKFLNKYSNKL